MRNMDNAPRAFVQRTPAAGASGGAATEAYYSKDIVYTGNLSDICMAAFPAGGVVAIAPPAKISVKTRKRREKRWIIRCLALASVP